jgi:hypothetical protein
MGDGPEHEPLTGGFRTSAVTRIGGVVRRSAGPWSPTVHAWLAHLAEVGLDLAPRPVALDLESGIEELTYTPGAVMSGGASPDYLWSDGMLVAIAHIVRQFHDAAQSFVPPADAAWQETMALPGGGDVICHNDLAPWNTVSSCGSSQRRSLTGTRPHPARAGGMWSMHCGTSCLSTETRPATRSTWRSSSRALAVLGCFATSTGYTTGRVLPIGLFNVSALSTSSRCPV